MLSFGVMSLYLYPTAAALVSALVILYKKEKFRPYWIKTTVYMNKMYCKVKVAMLDMNN